MKYRKLTSVILTSAMIMSIGTAAGAVPEEEDGIAGFVERAYSLILGRESDPDGKADWCDRLSSGDITAAEMIHGFVYSNEFQTADIDNEEKVEIMYSVMLDRTPDETGHEHWLSLLENGAQMDDIIAGFCGSQEFLGICSDYGITAGTVAGTDYRTGMFIERCYQLVLGRGSDDQGKAYWYDYLRTDGNFADEALYGFVFSPENLAKAQTDSEFIELLYNNCLGRASDEAGKADWLSRMDKGMTKVRVFRNFVQSAEFTEILSEYDLSVDKTPYYLDNGIHTGLGIYYPGDGPLVCIDPGHQMRPDFSTEPNGPGSSVMKILDPGGTAGVSSRVSEYQLNLEVSLKLRDAFLDAGYSVLMTRETHDVDLGNVKRASLANEYGADIMIRIHGNSLDNHSYRGTLAVVTTTSNPFVGSISPESQRLGTCLVNNMCALTGFPNRGLLFDDTMTGNNWAKMPCVLLEMGFMSNPAEDMAMQDPAVQAQIVAGIVNGANEYFGR